MVTLCELAVQKSFLEIIFTLCFMDHILFIFFRYIFLLLLCEIKAIFLILKTIHPYSEHCDTEKIVQELNEMSSQLNQPILITSFQLFKLLLNKKGMPRLQLTIFREPNPTNGIGQSNSLLAAEVVHVFNTVSS